MAMVHIMVHVSSIDYPCMIWARQVAYCQLREEKKNASHPFLFQSEDEDRFVPASSWFRCRDTMISSQLVICDKDSSCNQEIYFMDRLFQNITKNPKLCKSHIVLWCCKIWCWENYKSSQFVELFFLAFLKLYRILKPLFDHVKSCLVWFPRKVSRTAFRVDHVSRFTQ